MRILNQLFASTVVCTLVAVPFQAAAGTVKIEQMADRTVAVTAEGATISEVVAKLGEAYGFRLDHKGNSRPSDATRDEQLSIDGRFDGSLRSVLDRILQKESYFIELANQSRSGIARVVLYNAQPVALAAVGNLPGGAQRVYSDANVVRPEPVMTAPVPVAAPAAAAARARVAPMPRRVEQPRAAAPIPQSPALVPPVRRQPSAAPSTQAAAASAPGTVIPAPAAAARRRGGVIQ
jgi:hypothetical protein